MDEVEARAGGTDLHLALDLAAAAFSASRQAATAKRFARRCAPLAEAAVALAVTDEAARAVHSIRRRTSAAARRAESCATDAREASLALAAAVRVFAQPSPASARSSRARAVRDACASTQRALDEVRRHAVAIGRLAAGLAAGHPGSGAAEEVAELARRLLVSCPLPEEERWAHELGSGERAWVGLAGLVAHASHRPVSTVAITADDGRHRWVSVVYDDAVHLGCTSDLVLAEHERLAPEQHEGLRTMGLHPPDDDHLGWWRTDAERTVADVTDHLLEAASILRVDPGDDVVVWIGQPAGHPDLLEPEDDPAVLDLAEPTVPLAAEALAERLQLGIEAVGIDSMRLFVHQGLGWSAHLTSDGRGNLVTDVANDASPGAEDGLTGAQKAQLRTLGWELRVEELDDLDSVSFVRVWPAPFDPAVACWHLMVTVAAVCGLDPDMPIRAAVTLAE